MTTAKIEISAERPSLERTDGDLDRGLCSSVAGLTRPSPTQSTGSNRRLRLARECAKLNPEEETAAAEERFVGEVEWPENQT